MDLHTPNIKSKPIRLTFLLALIKDLMWTSLSLSNMVNKGEIQRRSWFERVQIMSPMLV